MGKHAATPSAEALAAQKKPRTVPVSLVLDEETGDTATFVFAALPRDEFRDMRLLPECQPTKEQRRQYADARKAAGIAPHQVGALDNNPDVFPPMLMAACCTSHEWDADGWSLFLATLNDAEFGELFGGAIAAQATRARVPDPEA